MSFAANALDRPPRRPDVRPARAFTLGRPASRLEAIAGALVSMLDLLRPVSSDDRPPLALALVKLAALVVTAVAVTTVTAAAAGLLVAKLYLDAFG
jgi:hypothetical protein